MLADVGRTRCGCHPRMGHHPPNGLQAGGGIRLAEGRLAQAGIIQGRYQPPPDLEINLDDADRALAKTIEKRWIVSGWG